MAPTLLKNFLGIDPSSSRTGYALVEELGEGRYPRITPGSFTCTNEDVRSYADNCRLMSDRLYELLTDLKQRKIRVDVAGLEPPIITMGKRKRQVTDLSGTHIVEEATTNAHTLQLLASLSGTALDILHRFKVRTELIPVGSWRKFCIGRSTAPAGTPDKERSGWGKRETRRWATDLGLRCGFQVKNADQSDAVGIALYTACDHGNSMEVRKMLASRRIAA